jgi:hypothetical protein
MTGGRHAISLLKDKREIEALAALSRLDIGRLNEVITEFTQFSKSGEENSVSHCNIFPMLQKLISNPRPLSPKKHAETFMRAVSEPFSKRTDLHITSARLLVTPVGKRYYEADPQPGAFATSLETMCSHTWSACVFKGKTLIQS